MYHPHHIRIGLLGLILLASPTVARAAEADLLATLNDENAAFFDKTMACKQLAVQGTEAAVPVLAGLLEDAKLSHYARYGLEPIPSPEVDNVLIAALSTVQGRHLIGVINSLANRGKPAAIDALAGKLNDADPAVAKAAAHSIARLGTPQAAKALGQVLCPEFAAAGLVCGKTLAGQGHKEEATSVYASICGMENAPKHVVLAASLQAAELLSSEDSGILARLLASDDKATFNMGLRTARLIDANVAAKAALVAFEDASPPHSALLAILLGDLGDPAGLPAIVQAASHEDISVRVAALAALATMGNADHVGLLMTAASDMSVEVSAQALKTLGVLPGDDVDQTLLGLLDDQATRTVAIRLVGRRRITAAVPKLLVLLDGPEQLEVVAALGGTIPLDQLDILGKMLDADSAELREAVRTALHAACYRMPDRDGTAEKLSAYLDAASDENVPFVMDQLRVIGGPVALATAAQAAQGGDDLLKDYATRALGEWLDTSAAPILLALAEREGSGKYGVRGMRGYIRLARQFSMPEKDRVQMCRTVLRTAARDDEKKLVLEVLARYPSADMLKLATDAAQEPALKAEASRTARIITKKLGGK